MTQPVLTRGLRELETVLGVELFERGPRGMAPTLYGAPGSSQGHAADSGPRAALRAILFRVVDCCSFWLHV
ncbi:LysR family transcriptional regulator [Streptomyces sp. NPDC004296]|uniref:helix-turn-helix domain-containing protein n=1 Tax=Streptomyces sp. NPDC004296 TaxID=3364697 RepID=UPI003678EA7A